MTRFSLRDLFWLTLLVAAVLGMGRGWWLDRVRLEALDDKLSEAELRAEDLTVNSEWLRQQLRLAMKQAQAQSPTTTK